MRLIPRRAARSTNSGVREPHADYRGRTVVFGTAHRKDRYVATPFADILGVHISAPPHLDTDRFGTFTGDIARTRSPLDTARAKARLAIEQTANQLALASEATYGPLPGLGLPGHEEILLFIDDTRGIEVVEGHRTFTTPAATRVIHDPSHTSAFEDLLRFGQALIVRPNIGGTTSDIAKGVTSNADLDRAVTTAAARSVDGLARVEPDLRAHHNPTRQAVLYQLAVSLATRLSITCLACGCPGWGRIDVDTGLPCAYCGTPTEAIRADIIGCPRCAHKTTQPRTAALAEPRSCPTCNP